MWYTKDSGSGGGLCMTLAVPWLHAECSGLLLAFKIPYFEKDRKFENAKDKLHG